MTISPEDYGLDGSISNNINACLNSVYSTAQSKSQNFLTGLSSAVQLSPSRSNNDPLSHLTSASLNSLEVIQIQYISKDDNSVLHPLEMNTNSLKKDSSVQNGGLSSTITSSSSIMTITIALVCGTIFMVVVTAFVVRKSRYGGVVVDHIPLSDKSSHLDNSINKVSIGTSLDIEN